MIRLVLLFILLPCQTQQAAITATTNVVKFDPPQQIKAEKQKGLFKLDINLSENFVLLIPPENSDFELPDSSAKTEPYKSGDFNADGKKDILIYLGACGTGGCMYGLFLNQYDKYYKLAFIDYLKNTEFKIDKDGLWTIESSEEIEPYNPSKLQITIFKFDKEKYQYEQDTTFVYIDEEVEKLQKNRGN